MGYAFSLVTRHTCTITLKKIWDKGINNNEYYLTNHHPPSHHRRMWPPFILKAHIVRNPNFWQSSIFKTQFVRGCVPGPILVQGHLNHSDHSGSNPAQGHSVNSDYVYHYLTLRPWTLQDHDKERGRTVHSYHWWTDHAYHVRHGGKLLWIVHTYHCVEEVLGNLDICH